MKNYIMGCGCKKNIESVNNDKKIEIVNNNNKVIGLILFLVITIFSPLLLLFILWVLFKHLVIGNSIDLLSLFKTLKNKLDNSDDEDEEDVDINTLNPEEYKLIGVDEIIK